MFGYFYYLLNSAPKNVFLRTSTHLGRDYRTGAVPGSSWLVSLEKEFWEARLVVLTCICLPMDVVVQ